MSGLAGTALDPAEVGIIGASGEVGAAAAALLARSGIRLRLGGRRTDAVRAVAAVVGAKAEARTVDVADSAALRDFAAGCRVVLNCVGPGELVAEHVRTAVIAAGADYVDVASGQPGRAALPAGRVAVLSAGLSPGLSGLLPGLLADGLDTVEDFEGAYCGLGVFTESAAVDYLLSMRGGYGTSMASWQNGRLAPATLQVNDRYQLPLVPGTVTGHPFLTEELRTRAAALGIPSARWYNAFDGEHLVGTLTRLQRDAVLADGQNGPPDLAELAQAAKTVVRASALDAAGRTPYHLLNGRMRGTTGVGVVVRSAVIRGTDGSRLTGAMAAIAVEAVLAGAVPPGTHPAAAVLNPEHTVNRLRDHLPADIVSVTEQPLELAAAPVSATMVEGEL